MKLRLPWSTVLDHTPNQLLAIATAARIDSAALLTDALLVACSPQSPKALEAMRERISRLSGDRRG